MYCPKCNHTQADGRVDCEQCGIFFVKYKKAQQRLKQQEKELSTSILWQMPEANSTIYRGFRALLLLFLIWWSDGFISSSIMWQQSYAGASFMHSIHLPFHEFGHKMFAFMGHFMGSLGGTLGQVLMPVICLFTLLLKTRDAFGAAVCLWWLGESVLDTAPYINDARDLSMPLLGGNFGHSSPYGFHDWEYILGELGLAHVERVLAQIAHVSGSAIMIVAILWMLKLVLMKHQGERRR